MKRRFRIRKPVAIIIILLPVASFAFFLFFPSGFYMLSYLSKAYLFDREDWLCVTVRPEERKLDTAGPAGGTVLEGYGYSVTVTGYEGAAPKPDDKDSGRRFALEGGKSVTLEDYYERRLGDGARFVDVYTNSGKTRKLVEAATGRPLVTEYDLCLANITVTPWDFAVFDNAKGVGLDMMLRSKAFGMQHYSRLYLYDNGEIMGIGMAGDQIFKLELFDADNLDRLYGIQFEGAFTQEEVEAIIGTIHFNS